MRRSEECGGLPDHHGLRRVLGRIEPIALLLILFHTWAFLLFGVNFVWRDPAVVSIKFHGLQFQHAQWGWIEVEGARDSLRTRRERLVSLTHSSPSSPYVSANATVYNPSLCGETTPGNRTQS